MEDGKVMSKLEVLYEDNHLIVVVKPANIPSQQDSSNDLDLLTMVKEYVKDKYHKPGNVYIGLVHRLDRPVSGIMVFARTSKAASRLSDQIRKKEFSKKYLAVVNGIIEKDEDKFVDYLKRENNGNTVVTDSSDGKESILNYNVLEKNYDKNETLVEIELETGRHHQIRVQFASRNHPLVGDNRYGIDKEKNIGLFAYQLSFIHPVKKEVMTFTYLPKDKPFNIFKI